MALVVVTMFPPLRKIAAMFALLAISAIGADIQGIDEPLILAGIDEVRGQGVYKQIIVSEDVEYFTCRYDVGPKYIAWFRQIETLSECKEFCDYHENCTFVYYNYKLTNVKMNCRLYAEECTRNPSKTRWELYERFNATETPTQSPTFSPTPSPTNTTLSPTESPTLAPTGKPSPQPTVSSLSPTASPSTASPSTTSPSTTSPSTTSPSTASPSASPTASPSSAPSGAPVGPASSSPTTRSSLRTGAPSAVSGPPASVDENITAVPTAPPTEAGRDTTNDMLVVGSVLGGLIGVYLIAFFVRKDQKKALGVLQQMGEDMKRKKSRPISRYFGRSAIYKLRRSMRLSAEKKKKSIANRGVQMSSSSSDSTAAAIIFKAESASSPATAKMTMTEGEAPSSPSREKQRGAAIETRAMAPSPLILPAPKPPPPPKGISLPPSPSVKLPSPSRFGTS